MVFYRPYEKKIFNHIKIYYYLSFYKFVWSVFLFLLCILKRSWYNKQTINQEMWMLIFITLFYSIAEAFIYIEPSIEVADRGHGFFDRRYSRAIE